MKNILTIGASTSRNSINKILAEYAGELLKNVNLIKVDLNDYEMPLFSVDIENEKGFPQSTIEFNNIIDKADGFIISLAEHNGAYSAAFKNSFDWLSRIDGKVWRNKPMLLLSTSPGGRGGQSVMELALSRFPHSGGKITGSMTFPSFFDNFQNGDIVNSELKTSLIGQVNTFEKAL